ncbi:MAG: hypothetical protein L3K06_00930, partial [Thermoplasmata archaeon]|nr:hypothetical protein [Thermoplasmata archaeon]
MFHSSLRAVAPWALLALTLFAGPGALGVGPHDGAGGNALAPHSVPSVPRAAAPLPRPVGPSVSTVNYTSSVDSFPLSYSEILPTGFSSSTRYPLAVEMHGIAVTESTPMRGGYPTVVDPNTAGAATDAGFILIVPNTRTGDGFYIDSPTTGPQAQDIQDAIHVEQSLRLIGSIYLFGFSMGGMGSLSIGLQHPSEFAGLGAIATFSDIYQLYDYQASHGSAGLNGALLDVAGGSLPNASAFSHQVFDELSELRAHPGGPLFAELGYASYLIWAAPEERVFVDPRFELFPLSLWG